MISSNRIIKSITNTIISTRQSSSSLSYIPNRRWTSSNNSNHNNNNNDVHLVFYTRPTCSLCLDAKEILYPIADEVNENKENIALNRKIVIDEINIDLPQHHQHHEKWKYDVPVGMIGSKIVFKHRINDLDKLFFDLDQYLNKPINNNYNDNNN
ncbi:hypothetical protein DFA_04863 [Cavenderia fasciculata]|uniref:Glutaredoxin-like protein n=1 Tax=Cavenderia fasciculata TaxID=261658 RepID=F4PM30_CACFS|nr:uncharacterized protein DFA_04863 [Cavenderia fasciculata]EGG22733.1 hypothetical protein DFA_04863 [Cavenderia fasciculata]|eukprot:XP_004360584.1 hypothetical protein DFA_04863 [Cavenderia fasciculata]